MSIPQSLKQANQAVALKYAAEDMDAPQLVAKGDDELAQAIIELALANAIPIYENASLSHWLSQLEIGEEIPDSLYQVIAEILAVVYRLEGKEPVKPGS